MTTNRLTLYLDLDDTLISTQEIFEATKRECATYIQQQVMTSRKPSIARIMETFNAYEQEFIQTHGLRNSRFILSWVETMVFYIGSNKQKEQEVRHMASRVFRTSARRFDDAIPVLEALQEAGYRLHLLTSGEEDTQRYRVKDAGLEAYFDTITVVSEKTPETYQRLIPNTENSVMIGNSITADINPSLQSGMYAILVEEGNSWFFDISEEIESDRKWKGMLKDVPRLVQEIEASRKGVLV